MSCSYPLGNEKSSESTETKTKGVCVLGDRAAGDDAKLNRDSATPQAQGRLLSHRGAPSLSSCLLSAFFGEAERECPGLAPCLEKRDRTSPDTDGVLVIASAKWPSSGWSGQGCLLAAISHARHQTGDMAFRLRAGWTRRSDAGRCQHLFSASP